MSMNVGPDAGSGEMCDINTTPLIDVMTHAVKLDMPNANHPPPPQDQRPEVIDLEIDYDGTVVWNGTPVPNMPTLEQYFRTESMKDPQPEIHLRPDPLVKYDFVAKVLAAAQHNSMKKIGFVNTAQFGTGF